MLSPARAAHAAAVQGAGLVAGQGAGPSVGRGAGLVTGLRHGLARDFGQGAAEPKAAPMQSCAKRSKWPLELKLLSQF